MKIVVEVDLAKCMHVKLEQEKAIELINALIRSHGIVRDLEEAKRVVENFDEYYNIARRRFESYIVIPKDVTDSLRGRALIHKLRLIVEDGKKLVEIVFDKRVREEFIIEILKRLGYEVEVKHATL
ncbi:MAG: hypothetical protein ACP5KA_02550 [Desulfurococcaceae archaeon]